MSAKQRKQASGIAGQFIAHLREMRNSIAWKRLDGNDKLVLERIEEEHVAHGGKENGRLRVTYSDFVAAGVRRAAVSRCLAKLEALGFIECTDRGRAARADFRFPAAYRVTYLPGNTTQSHEWRAITAEAEADRRIANALRALDARSADLRKSIQVAQGEKSTQGRSAA